MSRKKSAAVAVITRTKNRPLLLERAINSVLNQTFEDFIVVIMNDGGDKRDVEQLVKKYEKKAKHRIQVIHNEQSIGMQSASNKAIRSVDSEYVVVHDDDDTWHPEFLERTVAHFQASGSLGVIAATDLVVEEIVNDKVKEKERFRLYPGLASINLYKMCYENYAAPISFIYARKVFKEIGYYDESLGGVGDWDFGLRFLLKYDIDFLQSENALAYYHQRPQDTSINGNSIYTDTHKRLEDFIANKYLRQEINEGKMGLGYLISSTKHIRSLWNQSREEEYIHTENLIYEIQQLKHHIHSIEQSMPPNNPGFISTVMRLPIRATRKTKRLFGGR